MIKHDIEYEYKGLSCIDHIQTACLLSYKALRQILWARHFCLDTQEIQIRRIVRTEV
jgi:hypothetical protein